MYIRPAYDQLSQTERLFVDQVVSFLDEAAQRMNERITRALDRPLPPQIVERSHGMLERGPVQAAIESRIRQIAADQELTPQGVLRELTAIATGNISDFMRIEGDSQVFDFSRVTRSQWSAVKKIELEGSTEDESLFGGRAKPPKIKIEMHSKLDAIKIAMQYMNMLDGDSPVWQSDRQAGRGPALPAGASASDAGEAYARYLEN